MKLTPLERVVITEYVKTFYSDEINVLDDALVFPERYSESYCDTITVRAFLASDIVHKRLKVKSRGIFQYAVEQAQRAAGVRYVGKGKGYRLTSFYHVSDQVDDAFAKRCREIVNAESNASGDNDAPTI